MAQWTRWWAPLRDILLTGTGLGAIWHEIYLAHPSGLVLGTGLALTVPSVAAHVKALLPSEGGDTDSSPSSPAHGQLAPGPGSQPEEGAGE